MFFKYLTTAAIAAALSIPVLAHADDDDDNGSCTGLYMMVETDARLRDNNGDLFSIGAGASRLLNIHRDGSVTSSSSNEYQLAFTGSQGVWKKTGKHKIRVRTYDFSYNGGGGIPFGSFAVAPEFSGEVVIDLEFSGDCKRVVSASLDILACPAVNLPNTPVDINAVDFDNCAEDAAGFESDLEGVRLTP